MIWIIASNKINNDLFLPSPFTVFAKLIQMLGSDLLTHAWASFKRITIGAFIAGGVAIPLGMIIGEFTPVSLVMNPIIGFLKYIPITAFTPLLLLFVGIEESMKIWLIFIAIFLQYLPIVINEYQDVDKHIVETANTMGFSRFRLIRYVIIPYITPEVLRNFVSMYGIGWTFVIIAELTNAPQGLGHLMYAGSARGNTPMVFAALMMIIIINITVDKICKLIIKKKFSWRYKNAG